MSCLILICSTFSKLDSISVRQSKNVCDVLIPYIWNLKRNDTNEPTKQKETHRLREQTYGCHEVGIGREFGHVHACVYNCLVVSDSLQPVDCSPWGSSVHGIFQVRVLKCCHVLLQGILSTQGSNLPTALGGRFFTTAPTGMGMYTSLHLKWITNKDL